MKKIKVKTKAILFILGKILSDYVCSLNKYEWNVYINNTFQIFC